MTIGFLGPAHSFSERAALALGGGGPLVPLPDIAALFAALADGEVASIVVPLENSEVGAVPATLAELRALAAPLAVVGEVRLPVRFALYRRAGDHAPLERVVAHAMSLAQCAPWIGALELETRAVGSNGTAFAQVQGSNTAGEGALAPTGIEVVGMVVVGQDLQGSRAFETRFLLVTYNHGASNDTGAVDRALVASGEKVDLAALPGPVRRLAVGAGHHAAEAEHVYELAPAPPIRPDRLPGRPLLLWRARA